MPNYKPDLVLYHANCADGFGAAWACWMRWRDACQYTPASYGQEPPDVTGKHVLLVDFSYKLDVLREMGRKAASVIVLDHHKTAEADLSDWAIDDVAGMFWAGDDPLAAVRVNDEYVGQPIAALFDMNKSGARLAWEFCHEEDAPDLVTLIEDRDLWRFTDERTKPFSLWLRARPFDFAEWEMIAQEMNDADDSHRIMTEAAAMQTFSDQCVTDIASRARTVLIAGFKVPAVDCPPNFASEVCHALLVKNPGAPFAAAYSDNPNGKRGWSLRSQDHCKDVSEIAKQFGGGGHRNAAGFGVDLPPDAFRLEPAP